MDDLLLVARADSPQGEVHFGYARMGYALGQSKYIRDLLEKHNINQTAAMPCPKIEEGEEEPAENLSGPILRAAQQLCGELMWLTTSSRWG